MKTELFPPEQVSADSPRLRWFKKYAVKLDDFGSETESPEIGTIKRWLAFGRKGSAKTVSADGDTEDEALAALAKKLRVPLWNEETIVKKTILVYRPENGDGFLSEIQDEKRNTLFSSWLCETATEAFQLAFWLR